MAESYTPERRRHAQTEGAIAASHAAPDAQAAAPRGHAGAPGVAGGRIRRGKLPRERPVVVGEPRQHRAGEREEKKEEVTSRRIRALAVDAPLRRRLPRRRP